MDYSNFDTADFVTDDSFVAWVKLGENASHWESISRNYPEQRAAILQARAIIQAASQLPAFGLKENIHEIIWLNIRESMDAPQKPVRKLRSWYVAAAAVLIALVATTVMWFTLDKPDHSAYRKLVAKAEKKKVAFIESINKGRKPETVSLPDGSSVILQPGARISYPSCFTGKCHRQVFLSGAAFFEVKKNIEPFVVYANEMVINVLGTSFMVRAYDEDTLVSVAVKTGKVAIAIQPQENNARASLSANQQAILKRSNHTLDVLPTNVTIIAQPTVTELYSFVFADAPADSVFNMLENAYGVHINYDKNLMADCKLTASLDDEPLKEKLRLICQALEANCTIEGNEITITTKGCH
ncbi:FecR family protein [Chitinophaga sancti]|uniref:FecR family protein n=1 Tax=Chitinophaga sancti TaxID=1004 RepID=A0A1K1NPY2_9BACT|nr:FecR family protein [Chitinophaga sancti]WQD60107.1 FecR family protein [Chitinophaga sancti]WQG87765.1 FecR family protein [Chitinophaga sancti]SFW37562.1 FecR family protein [Chitinophaga sancti]